MEDLVFCSTWESTRGRGGSNYCATSWFRLGFMIWFGLGFWLMLGLRLGFRLGLGFGLGLGLGYG